MSVNYTGLALLKVSKRETHDVEVVLQVQEDLVKSGKKVTAQKVKEEYEVRTGKVIAVETVRAKLRTNGTGKKGTAYTQEEVDYIASRASQGISAPTIADEINKKVEVGVSGFRPRTATSVRYKVGDIRKRQGEEENIESVCETAREVVDDLDEILEDDILEEDK